jgi:hypothetical protein
MVPSVSTRGLVMLFHRHVTMVASGATGSDRATWSSTGRLGVRKAVDAEAGVDDSAGGGTDATSVVG